MKKNRQWRSNQGRSPKRVKESTIVFGISAIGLFLTILSIALWTNFK